MRSKQASLRPAAIMHATIGLTMALAPVTRDAAAAPILWGYGVKTCAQFLDAAPGTGAPSSIASDEFTRFREWLAGLVSGLNLASGSDVLAGAQLEAALARVRSQCAEQPNQDFFNASIQTIKALSKP